MLIQAPPQLLLSSFQSAFAGRINGQFIHLCNAQNRLKLLFVLSLTNQFILHGLLLNYLTWILAKNESTTEYGIESITNAGVGTQLKNLINGAQC